MINTAVQLEKSESPFLHYTGKGLLSAETVKELNAVLPERRLYSREVKTGSQHRKEYRMWRCEPAVNSTRTTVADELPSAWSNLVDGVLSPTFRAWVTEQTGVDVTTCPLTAGLYILDDGDFTTTDTGKTEKLLTFALYLNEHWDDAYGGKYQLLTGKTATEPVREIAPVGGTCTTMTPSETSWHRIQPVDTGGRTSRMMMMLEFWRA
jgi:hypothetical protein